jgi:signal peptidase I
MHLTEPHDGLPWPCRHPWRGPRTPAVTVVWVTTEAGPRTASPWWRRVLRSAWFPLAASLVITGLVLSFVAKPYWVPSASMQATLQAGDRILVNRLAFAGADPGTGDVIVFDAGADWVPATSSPENPLKAALRWVGEVSGFGPSSPHTLVKRVIGTPGQTVQCCTDTGAVTVEGDALSEPYVANDFPFTAGSLDCATVPRSPRCFDPITVPAGSYLMLGDNRTNSADSAAACRTPDASDECWRWASRDAIVGKAVLIFWPIGRWAGL